MSEEGLARIKAVFDEIFDDWGTQLPESDLTARNPGSLRQRGGHGLTRYAFGTSDGKDYLEFYSFHRIQGDYHARIHASGEVEVLAVLETMLAVSDDPEEMRRRTEEQDERNRKLIEELDRAGLREGGPVPMSFEINAYLTTGHRDLDEGDHVGGEG